MSNFKKYKSIVVRKLLSPSVRFEIQQMLAWTRERINRACLWRWEITSFPHPQDRQYDIRYVGRKGHRELARILLGIEKYVTAAQAGGKPPGRVLVSEMPLPGTIRVPHYLRAAVPLGRSVDEILATYDDKLRRSILKHRPLYRMRQALSDAEIDHADRAMLQPYATARHGNSANQKLSSEVRRCALEFGRLDLVLSGDEVVACLLGSEYIRNNKRYWMVDRFGYPEAVFSDPKRLGVINSVNNHIALEWAINNGYDFYDIGLCFGRPDDGLIQWKKRRGAALDRIGLKGYGHFYIRLPKNGAAQFLWDTPLFAAEGRNLTLHLGLPEGRSDDEFMSRYSTMGFEGLSRIYLHSTRQPDEQLLVALRSIYKHRNSPPGVEIILSS